MSDIEKLLPHRPPFLYVDRIVEIHSEKIVAERTFSADESFFKGHYPGAPVTPGVLLCEAVFQAGACLIARHHLGGGSDNMEGKVPVLARIQSAKFRRIVPPDVLLTLTVELKEQLSGVFFMKGSVKSEGKVAVYVDFSCTLADAPVT